MPNCVDANRDEYSQRCECDDFWITRKQPPGTREERLWLPISLTDVLRQLEDHFGSDDKVPLVIRAERLLGSDALSGHFAIDDFLITTNCRKNLLFQSASNLPADFAIAEIETMLQVPHDKDEAETRWDSLWEEAEEQENP